MLSVKVDEMQRDPSKYLRQIEPDQPPHLGKH
jgi:hypothetical protein